MKLGIEVLIENESLKAELKGQKVALLAHPASVNHQLQHSMDLLFSNGIELVSAFGPQHGLRGDKQDNMVESEDHVDSVYQIPVYSLYGKTRKLTDEMLQEFDTILIDLQDIGGRVYTFITTMLYILRDCAETGKSVWVLDRPNPAGRPIDGLRLRKGNESFVGAGSLPMRHGLTMGEVARWFVVEEKINVDLQVVAMSDYRINASPYFGWPQGELSWVNPSPNISTLNGARCFSGTVLLEGTEISEGRGTTRPLELFGAPDLETDKILKEMNRLAPDWLKGILLRPCNFQPTFQKYEGKLCHGWQIHSDMPSYDHGAFRPFRLVSLFLKALRRTMPDYKIWRDFDYEYEFDRQAIDVINGGGLLREWIDDSSATVADLEELLVADEESWKTEIRELLLYHE